jgi:hypothetical protein
MPNIQELFEMFYLAINDIPVLEWLFPKNGVMKNVIFSIILASLLNTTAGNV